MADWNNLYKLLSFTSTPIWTFSTWTILPLDFLWTSFSASLNLKRSLTLSITPVSFYSCLLCVCLSVRCGSKVWVVSLSPAGYSVLLPGLWDSCTYSRNWHLSESTTIWWHSLSVCVCVCPHWAKTGWINVVSTSFQPKNSKGILYFFSPFWPKSNDVLTCFVDLTWNSHYLTTQPNVNPNYRLNWPTSVPSE